MNCQRLLRCLVPFKQSRSIFTTAGCKVPDMHEHDHKGRAIYNKSHENVKSAEELIWEKSSFKDKIKLELKLIKKELKLFKKEISKSLDYPMFVYRPGEVDVYWRFSEDPECLDNWIVSADCDYNEGFSQAKLELSPHGTGVFSGNLDTKVPQDGEVTHSGFCNIRTVNAVKSFQRATTLDWSNYTHLRMRVRGDGRFYWINLGLKQTFDVQWFQIYKYLLMTRGGPYWQDIRIPLSKFFLTHKGRVQDRQQPVEKHKIKNFGITLADKISGPFRLEIDYIGVEFDFVREEFAYESYDVPSMKM